jgi:catechol 2,3-dioxygenase-like lactoylglutathione lyase family enzyme
MGVTSVLLSGERLRLLHTAMPYRQGGCRRMQAPALSPAVAPAVVHRRPPTPFAARPVSGERQQPANRSTAPVPIHLSHLDHLVLTVADIDRTCDFYERVLGMRRAHFGDGRTALHFGSQKINLHAAGRPIDPNVRHAAPGSADLCFIATTPIADIVDSLNAARVPIIAGPGERSGARSRLMSVYFYDPDENLIEVANEFGSANPRQG